MEDTLAVNVSSGEHCDPSLEGNSEKCNFIIPLLRMIYCMVLLKFQYFDFGHLSETPTLKASSL